VSHVAGDNSVKIVNSKYVRADHKLHKFIRIY
ncbi:unnamed protein product, partial [Rotaria magnacalcarata]